MSNHQTWLEAPYARAAAADEAYEQWEEGQAVETHGEAVKDGDTVLDFKAWLLTKEADADFEDWAEGYRY